MVPKQSQKVKEDKYRIHVQMAFLIQEDKHKTRNEKARLPRESKVTPNKPNTLYTFHDGTKHQEKNICLP